MARKLAQLTGLEAYIHPPNSDRQKKVTGSELKCEKPARRAFNS